MELSDSVRFNVGVHKSAPLTFSTPPHPTDFVQRWLDVLVEQRAIAVIRSADWSLGHCMADAVIAGGMKLVEVTWNSDRPADLVQRLRAEYPECWVGAGTILTAQDLHEAVSAGAQFLFSPHTNSHLIQEAVQLKVPVIPGAMSPTEVVTAWQAGATCVKLFPINLLGGPTYVKSLRGPLSQIPLIPTGGITVDNAIEYIDAGAIAVGLAGNLFPTEAIATQNWSCITQQAKSLMQRLQAVT